MRIRTIKPEFWESESLGRVSRDARLLFIGLFTCCDDSGRARASSRLLASRLYPYDDRVLELIDGWLAELQNEGCIRIYTVANERYLDIPKWTSHQKIDKPSQSKLPANPGIVASVREDSRSIALEQGGEGNREQGKEQGGEEPTPVVPEARLEETSQKVGAPMHLDESEGITNKPTLGMAIRYFQKCSDFDDEEVKTVWLSFEATKGADGSWWWGKRLVGDWRSAMEARLGENRKRNESRPYAKKPDRILQKLAAMKCPEV